jgi:hypothetical protein
MRGIRWSASRRAVATPQRELLQGVERGVAGLCPHHPIGVAVAPPKVAGDRPTHREVVVDAQQQREIAHLTPSRKSSST